MDEQRPETLPTELAGTMPGCLRIEEVVAMVEGRLTAERGEVVLHHVDRCADCAELIASLGSLDGPARRIDRYQIERVLGTGAMGIVYAAFDPELQRRIAIKLVRPDAASDRLSELMVAEARALARVSHPNIVTVHDVGEHGGEIFIATELVDGTTLADWQIGRSELEIVQAWIQVAHGLAAAHAVGIIHRDVKPSNVFVGRDGRVRVGDFGIAHAGERLDVTPLPEPLGTPTPMPLTKTSTGTIAGTPAYMAPEQKRGKVDARSDQFSTCVGLVEALTGNRPGPDDRVVLPNAALAAALMRGLAAEPGRRFPSMRELADALAAAIAPPPPAPPRWRRLAIIAALAAVAATVIVVTMLPKESASATCNAALVPAKIWSPARRARLAAALEADPTPSLERWLARWSAAAGDVCLASDSGAVRAYRERCFAERLADFDKLVTSWETEKPGNPFAPYEQIEQLTNVARCSRRSAVAAVTDPAAVTRRIAAIAHAAELDDRAAAIASLRAALPGPADFSRIEVALALIALLETSELAEIERLIADTRGWLAALGGDPEAQTVLDHLAANAYDDAGRRTEAVAAREHVRLGVAQVYGEGSPFEAKALVELAGTYYGRDGVTSRLARAAAISADEIWARNRIPAPSLVRATTSAENLEKVQQFRAYTIEQTGPESKAAFAAEYTLLNAYVIDEKREQAIAQARHLLELGKRVGIRDRRSVSALARIAELSIELGQPEQAIAPAREGIALAGELDLDGELARARTMLGWALLESNKPGEARPLLRAEVRRDAAVNNDAKTRGLTRFLLARAEWDVDRQRALDHARVARVELESALETPELDAKTDPVGAPHLRRHVERTLAELDRWLATHER